jgi:hypothetical protein
MADKTRSMVSSDCVKDGQAARSATGHTNMRRCWLLLRVPYPIGVLDSELLLMGPSVAHAR